MSDSPLALASPTTTALGPSHRLTIDGTGSISTFTVGCHYYGSLLCGNSQYKVLCVRRTAKSVWLAEYQGPMHFVGEERPRGAAYGLPRRSKIKWFKGQEYTSHGNWSIDSDGYDDSDPPNSH